MNRAVVAAGLIVILAASCTPASPQSQDQKPVIAIASDLPTSGAAIADVAPLRAAIALAIEQRGSIHGYRLIHQPFDDALVGSFEPFKGEQNVKIMIKDPRILAMVGPYNSPVALFEIPVANEAGLVMISPSNTMDCLTFLVRPCPRRSSSMNSYFRISAPDSKAARAGAVFATRKLNVKRFAVLTDETQYGDLLYENFSSELKANGGAVVFRDKYSRYNDYKPLLRQARDAGAEAIYVGGFPWNGVCRIRGSMAGVFPADTYMFAGDWVVETTDCPAEASGGANDHFLAIVSDSQPPPNSKVYKLFQARGIRPTTYAFGAYDCAMIAIDAISRAMDAKGGKLPTRREVLNAVAATRDFVGTTGTFTFQPNGDAVNPAVSVYRLQDGHWSFWQSAS